MLCIALFCKEFYVNGFDASFVSIAVAVVAICLIVVAVVTVTAFYQVGQLTWTIVTICMIVAQVKFVAHNIFNGIFWFFFPASLVICNDISAYFW